METVAFAAGADGVHVPKMLVATGLAPSRTEAERLLKSGAVEIDGERCAAMVHPAKSATLTVRAGKKWKRVTVTA
jgi:tyrosyl-tRNA synthetase